MLYLEIKFRDQHQIRKTKNYMPLTHIHSTLLSFTLFLHRSGLSSSSSGIKSCLSWQNFLWVGQSLCWQNIPQYLNQIKKTENLFDFNFKYEKKSKLFWLKIKEVSELKIFCKLMHKTCIIIWLHQRHK